MRIPVAAVAALFLLSACAGTSATIKSGELSEQDARAYLILSDQLRRVRNVWKNPVGVCLAAGDLGDTPLYRTGLDVVSPEVLDRLRADNENAEIKLNIESSQDCLSRHAAASSTTGKVLVLAGQGMGSSPMGAGNCKQFEGVIYAPPINRLVTYDFEQRDGVLALTGGDVCITGWYRQ